MENPLLESGITVPFDRIRAEHIEPGLRYDIERADRKVQAIVQAPTLEANILRALDDSTTELEIASSVVEHLESVRTTPEQREAYNQILPEVRAFLTCLPLRPDLWNKLKAFAQSEAAQVLDPIQKRFLDKTLADFRRHGADLPAEAKAELEKVDRELTVATNRFSQNVLDATNAYELLVADEAKLAGLPESALALARESAARKGVRGYRLTLQTPNVIGVLTYADDRSLREQIWRAFNNRATGGTFDNSEVLLQILRLRKKKAEILGFAHFADLVTEDRMVKTGQAVRDFLSELSSKTRAAFERENQELRVFARDECGANYYLAPWDIGYFAEKMKKKRHLLDEEELRGYFPAEAVLKGVFELAERLYGVKIEQVNNLPVWDLAVRSFRLSDQAGQVLGIFHVDLYPRENKRGGAWMHGLVTSTPPEPNLAVFCLNATPPTSDRPSLLLFQEVETVFHEFGHLLHHCFSRVPVRSLAGTRVAQDFVELPSQIMENFCFEPSVLALFARNYKTGEPPPLALIDRLRNARTFRAANAQMRQLGFATLDMLLHTEYTPEKDGNILVYARRILQEFAPAPIPNEYGMIATFHHLFSDPVGYAAGYYSYKWAEVLEADAFSRFRTDGVLNPSVGQAFRDGILAQGDARDPLELFIDFMGRGPRMEPLLERQGLLR